MRIHLLRDIAVLSFTTLIYFFAGKLGVKLAFAHPSAPAAWPPTGIALAVLLLFGYRTWPAILAGAFLVNITSGDSPAVGAGIAVGNTFGALAGAYLVRRFAHGSHVFDRAQDVLRFVIFAALMSTLISAMLGASLRSSGFGDWSQFRSAFIIRWLGEAAGVLLVAPPLIVWSRPPAFVWKSRRALEAVLLSVLLLTQIVFGGWFRSAVEPLPLPFTIIPLMVWVAVRFRQHGATLATLAFSAIAIYGTLRGQGPFARQVPDEALLLLQAFIGTTSVIALSLAALVGERAMAGDELRRSHFLANSIIDGATDAVFVKDVKGRYLMMNPAGAQFLGKRVEEVLGKDDRGLLSEESSQATMEIDHRVMLSGKPRTYEETVTAAGVTRTYSTTKAPYCDEKGRIIGVIGIARDITERAAAQEIVRRQTAALTQTLGLLAQERAPEAFLGQVLDAIGKELKASSTSIYLWDAEWSQPELSRAHETGRFQRKTEERASSRADRPGPVDGSDPAWQWVQNHRRPLVVERVTLSPLLRTELRAWATSRGLNTLLLVPMLWGNQVIGTVSVFNREERTYRPEEQELAQALTHQATLALQLMRLAEQREHAALLRERNRMAAEIHDTLAQAFTAVILQLQAAEDTMKDDVGAVKDHLLRASHQAREGLAEARRSVQALRPRGLEQGNLSQALMKLVEQANSNSRTRVQLSISGKPHPLPTEVEDNLLRISQEALANALKHAQANAVGMELAFDGQKVVLSIRDDGCGFIPGVTASDRGFGLGIMRERAQRVKGNLSVESHPGQGTRITAVVPVEENSSEVQK